MNKNVTFVVSTVLVGSMITVAIEEIAHGKAPSEAHLITSAPLVAFESASSTSVMLMLDPVMYNTIFDAAHATVAPEETELRLGGLTLPSDDAA